MEKFLTSIGISDVKSIVHNPSYDQLYEDELKPELEGFARGQLTELGAVNVLTGEYTGRSPKDKFIVMDDTPATATGGMEMAQKTTINQLILVSGVNLKHLLEIS